MGGWFTYLSEVLVSFQQEHISASVAPLDGVGGWVEE